MLGSSVVQGIVVVSVVVPDVDVVETVVTLECGVVVVLMLVVV